MSSQDPLEEEFVVWPKGSIQYLIKKVATGQKLSKDLTEDEAREMLKKILGGEATPAQTGAFFAALRMKGESAEELAGLTRAVWEHSERAGPGLPFSLDIGYPYDGKLRTDLFIVGAVFVAAGAGVPVALHGSRNVPPKRGRTPEELLEGLGLPVHLKSKEAAQSLRTSAFGYFACKNYNRALAKLLELPAEIGVRPALAAVHKLANPARAKTTILGITHPPYLASMSQAMVKLGMTGWVVKGLEGTMEFSLSHATTVIRIQNGLCETLEIDPRAYRLPLIEDDSWAQSSLEENAGKTEGALRNVPSPFRDMVLWNGAFLIFASGKCSSVEESLKVAEETMASRAALKALEKAKRVARFHFF